MEVDLDYDGRPTPEQLMDIDAEQTGREIRRKIADQAHSARRAKRPNDPLIYNLLVPPDLAQSTFRLPAVEKILREFLPLEEAVNDLLAPQINWAPPGYKPTDKLVRQAMARLWAIRTDGDGDCLLHSVSLSLWGQHDRTLVLRSLVVEVLQDKPSEKLLFRIWREGQRRADAAAGDSASFEMEEDQVRAEWHMLVDAANTPSAYLSSFHVFVLANALRRPILVYGDRFVRGKDGEPYAPSDVRGVYLPTLLAPKECYKLPIAVGYTCVAVGKVGHFTALVGVDGELRHLPLVDEHGENFPIRYGLPPATAVQPDPEVCAIEDYMITKTYVTDENKRYLLAVANPNPNPNPYSGNETREDKRYLLAAVRGAYMTREADTVRASMAQAAEASFDRLARAQEEALKKEALKEEKEEAMKDEEIEKALEASKNTDVARPTAPPPPPPSVAAGGNGGGQSHKPPPPPHLPLQDSEDPEAKLSLPSAAAAAAATVCASKADGSVGEGLVSRTGSTTTDLSDDPTAGYFAKSYAGGREGSDAAGAGAVALRGGGDGSGGTFGPGVAAGSDDAKIGSFRAEGGEVGGPGAAPLSLEGTRAPGGATAGGNESEGVPESLPPPLGSRLLSAPLGVLSAVGAWATGRGRTSVDDSAASAAAGDQGSATRSGGGPGGGGLAAREASLLRDGLLVPRAGNSAGSGSYRPPDLELDVSAQQGVAAGAAGGDDRRASAPRRRPPSVHLPDEGEGVAMDVDSPPKGSGRSEEARGAAAATNGKRKPVCSPAVTPDGPNLGHFGDTADAVGGMEPATATAAAAAGREEWRVSGTSTGAKAPGSRRSKGKTAASGASARRAAAAGSTIETGDAPAAASGGRGPRVPREDEKYAAYDIERLGGAAAGEEAYHVTAGFRAARAGRSAGGGRGGAGSRRGQPHPRGADGETSSRGGPNPWLGTEESEAQRRLRESRAHSNVERDRRYPTSGSSSNIDMPDATRHSDESVSPTRGGGMRSGTAAASTARYHSRSRLPEERGAGGLENGGRAVRDGIHTMSLGGSGNEDVYRGGGGSSSSSSSSSKGGRFGERTPRRAADATTAAAVPPAPSARSRAAREYDSSRYEPEDDSPYLQQTKTASLSASAAADGMGSPLPESELSHSGLYHPAPPADVAAARAARARRAAALATDPLSADPLSADPLSASRDVHGSSGYLARYNSDGGGSFGRRTEEFADGFSVGDEWRPSTVRGGRGRTASAADHEEDEAGCFVGSSGSFSYGGGGSENSAKALAIDRHRRDAAAVRERKTQSSRRLSSTSSSLYSSRNLNTRSYSSGSGAGGARVPSPAALPGSASSSASSSYWKSDSLRKALERPASGSSYSASATGRRSSWGTTSPYAAVSSSSSYLESKLARAGSGSSGAPSALHIPGAVAHGLSSPAAGRRLARAGSGVGSVRSSSGSVRSTAGSSSSSAPTLSSLRRQRNKAIEERRPMEAVAGGGGGRGARTGARAGSASRLHRAHAAEASKFY